MAHEASAFVGGWNPLHSSTTRSGCGVQRSGQFLDGFIDLSAGQDQGRYQAQHIITGSGDQETFIVRCFAHRAGRTIDHHAAHQTTSAHFQHNIGAGSLQVSQRLAEVVADFAHMGEERRIGDFAEHQPAD